jgi:hypothetical protein
MPFPNLRSAVASARGGCNCTHGQKLTAEGVEQVEYYPLIKELPATERPRERFKQYGAASLPKSELVAIIL